MKPAPQRLDEGKALRPSNFVGRQISALKLAPASSVLDLPCGTGRHSLYFGSFGHHVTAVDIDEELVGATVRRLRASDVNCSGVVADATKSLPFAPASFDLAVITDFVDEHLLATIGDVIRTGGHLIYESYPAKGGNWLQLLPPGRSGEVLEPVFEISQERKAEGRTEWFRSGEHQGFGSPKMKHAVCQNYSLQGNFTFKPFNTRRPARPDDTRNYNMMMPYQLPPLDLLFTGSSGDAVIDRKHLEHRAQALESALRAFGIDGSIIEVRPAPVFTAFYVELPPGVRGSRLASLGPDLARTLGVHEVLIKPVTGRSEPAIMMSNDMRQEIYLRELIASQAFVEAPGSLPFVLGKTLNGDLACYDLSSLHHLLLAGPTGSGKSISLHVILISLLYRLVPSQLRLVLIDLKGAELGLYDGIPHLLAPAAAEVHEAVGVLRWLVEQMDERLRLMADTRCRNLADFNGKAARDGRNGDQVELVPLCRILVAIDELADLMTSAFDDVDPLLQRLVGRGHLAGIHVILSTERPSSDVVSGGVKANLPSRLAFRVFSPLESRIILDENGAETLHGTGDMLMKALGQHLLRIHGADVEQAEIQAVVDHWKRQASPDYCL